MIILLTDFGLHDGYAAVMKGVIASIAPATQVIDLSHHIPPQDVPAAGFVLWNSYKHFPSGSIFCCVVDPGVGSERDIIAVQTKDYIFLAPDNGLLDYVLAELPIRQILKVENPALMRREISNTFHGRDIFAPTAAHLATGFLYTQLGPLHSYKLPPSPFVSITEAGEYEGKIIYFDHFGNAVSNLKWDVSGFEFRVSGFEFRVSGFEFRVSDHEAETSFLTIGDRRIAGLSQAYAEKAPGELLAIKGSHGLLEIAIRNGNAQTECALQYGDPIGLSWKVDPNKH